MKRKQVVLGEEHIEKVGEEAQRRGISFSAMLRKMICGWEGKK